MLIMWTMDEDYGYDPEFEDDDEDSSVDEDDNRTCVNRIGLMPGAAFGLPLHSFRFQK